MNVVDNKVMTEFTGSIDEDANFGEIEKVQEKEYNFDFDKVTMINSCGIREWINFIEKLPGDSKIVYKNCPQIIIEQMNMVHGFIREGAVIESFYAPYYDEETDNEHKILLKASQVVDGKAPAIKSPEGNDMEFDAIEEQYFSFLKSQK
jgi:hypothetical protein